MADYITSVPECIDNVCASGGLKMDGDTKVMCGKTIRKLKSMRMAEVVEKYMLKKTMRNGAQVACNKIFVACSLDGFSAEVLEEISSLENEETMFIVFQFALPNPPRVDIGTVCAIAKDDESSIPVTMIMVCDDGRLQDALYRIEQVRKGE